MDTIGTKTVKLISATNPNWAVSVTGRLDTGAARTSIDTLLAQALRLQVIDTITIRNSHGKTKREVVELTMLIEDVKHTVQATLAERAGLSCPLIIGRDVLDPNPKDA